MWRPVIERRTEERMDWPVLSQYRKSHLGQSRLRDQFSSRWLHQEKQKTEYHQDVAISRYLKVRAARATYVKERPTQQGDETILQPLRKKGREVVRSGQPSLDI